MPWVETVGEGESEMMVEITPKAHWDYCTDYTTIEEI